VDDVDEDVEEVVDDVDEDVEEVVDDVDEDVEEVVDDVVDDVDEDVEEVVDDVVVVITSSAPTSQILFPGRDSSSISVLKLKVASPLRSLPLSFATVSAFANPKSSPPSFAKVTSPYMFV
jgi:hypothetical protein